MTLKYSGNSQENLKNYVSSKWSCTEILLRLHDSKVVFLEISQASSELNEDKEAAT